MEKKARVEALSVEVKSEERGEVRARFATLNVKDKDGDMIVPGAFGKQDVLVSAYGHATWRGALPVGKGTITEDGDEAIADLKFFMDTDTGREHFRTVKNVGGAGEWSFGFDVTEWDDPDDDQREKGVDRVIKAFKVYEVSPVFRGAGVNTATLAVKSEDGEMEAFDPVELAGNPDFVRALRDAMKAMDEAATEPEVKEADGPTEAEVEEKADEAEPVDVEAEAREELMRLAAAQEIRKATGDL